jgi:hypothetical protein
MVVSGRREAFAEVALGNQTPRCPGHFACGRAVFLLAPDARSLARDPEDHMPLWKRFPFSRRPKLAKERPGRQTPENTKVNDATVHGCRLDDPTGGHKVAEDNTHGMLTSK